MRLATTPWLAFVAITFKLSAAENWETRFEGVTWDDDNWRLTNRNLDPGRLRYRSRVSLSNGYLGINFAALGPFFETDEPLDDKNNLNGWPIFDQRQAFATISGFWNYQPFFEGKNYEWLNALGGDSAISGIPHWGSLIVESEGHVLNASTNPEHIQGFRSTLDVAVAAMNWNYDWEPNGSGDVMNIEYNVFAHKLYINRAVVRLKITPTRDQNVTVYDILEGASATHTNFVEKGFEKDTPTIYTAVKPIGVSNITAYVYSTLRGRNEVEVDGTRNVHIQGPFIRNESSIAQSVEIEMFAGQTYILEKYIGGASSDAFPDPKEVARKASSDAEKRGYLQSLRTHITEWESLMPKNSVDRYLLQNGSLPEDENLRELQIVSVMNPFQLLQNTIGPKAIIAAGNNTLLGVNSIPVCGWSSSCYGGQIFWDAEAWMAPGLQVSHPYITKQIIEYRLKKFPMAKDNINSAYMSSQNKTRKFSNLSAVYPWTSARYGNCTATGPCFDYEYHVNGDIGIAMYNYYATTGDSEYLQQEILPVYNAIAQFYVELLTFNNYSGYYDLFNATDPDEFHNNVDNPGFTLALIRKHLRDTNLLNSWFGVRANSDWLEIISRIELPTNETEGIILEFANMLGNTTVKQADIVLIDDLLNEHYNYSLANLDYYAAMQSPDGPGMTYASFSIVANTVSPSGCSSYTYDLWSSKPYARAPWFQYSEQLVDNYYVNNKQHPAYPFLTGMGGSNRIAIFGYLGLQLFVDRLDIDPSLPPQIPRINYRIFYWMGHPINATANQENTTLSRLPRELSLRTANSTYFDKPIPVTFGSRTGKETEYLSYGSPLVVQNRRIGDKLTVERNVLQCRTKVNSPQPNVPGQFPLAAIDGAASTKWQPVDANETSWLTVDLVADDIAYPITEIFFDWGNQPPSHYEIIFTNKSYTPPFSDEQLEHITNVTASNDIEISHPYNAKNALYVQRYVGNQTNITLPHPVWIGRFVHLGISGNQNEEERVKRKDYDDIDDGSLGTDEWYGATVAEWSLVKVKTSETIAKTKPNEEYTPEWSSFGDEFHKQFIYDLEEETD